MTTAAASAWKSAAPRPSDRAVHPASRCRWWMSPPAISSSIRRPKRRQRHDLASRCPDPVPGHVPGPAGRIPGRQGARRRHLVPESHRHPPIRPRRPPRRGRHPVRRRRRHGDARRRAGRRHRLGRRRATAPHRAHPTRPAADPEPRATTRRRPRRHPPLRPLRRHRPARHRSPQRRGNQHRRLHPLRRRNRRPGAAGRRHPPAPRRHGCARQRRRGKLFTTSLLEYPHYTRPATWQDRAVPETLTSGNHKAIADWRRQAAAHITKIRRPDLYAQYIASGANAP